MFLSAYCCLRPWGGFGTCESRAEINQREKKAPTWTQDWLQKQTTRLRTSVEELGSDSVGRFWEEQASTDMILGAKGNLAIRHKNCMNVSLVEQLCWMGVRGVRRWPGRSWRTAADYTPTTHIPTHRYSTLTKQEWNLKFLKFEPENRSLEFGLVENVLHLDLIIESQYLNPE